jgi:hypothetical protein
MCQWQHNFQILRDFEMVFYLFSLFFMLFSVVGLKLYSEQRRTLLNTLTFGVSTYSCFDMMFFGFKKKIFFFSLLLKISFGLECQESIPVLDFNFFL